MKTKFSIDEKIQSYLEDEPETALKYKKIRKYVTGITSSGYDFSNRCNLKCEGCSYYEGDGWSNYVDNHELREWDLFFKKEVKRGVNYPFIAGGEPSLQIDRLILANEYWKHGMVFTNGIIPIPKEVSFSIHVSFWGNDESEKKLRGANCLNKIIDNYKDDERVIFVITISHMNVQHIKKLAQKIFDINCRIIFNHYSPTLMYNKKLKINADNDNKYFRISNKYSNLVLTDDDLKIARDEVGKLIDTHQDKVICSHYYNKWVTQPSGIYTIDENTGIATDCATRNAVFHKYFRADHKEDTNQKKCCIPFIDCYTCRGYAFSYPTLVSRLRRYVKNKTEFINWVETFDKWCELSFVGWRELSLEGMTREAFWSPLAALRN